MRKDLVNPVFCVTHTHTHTHNNPINVQNLRCDAWHRRRTDILHSLVQSSGSARLCRV
jgi:hypothetical protein